GARHLLLKDDLLDERRASAAVLGGPRDAAPSGFVERALPGLAVGDPLVEPLGLRSRRVRLEPRPELGAEALLVRGVGGVHRGKNSGATFCQNHASPGVSSTASTLRSAFASAFSLARTSRSWARRS